MNEVVLQVSVVVLIAAFVGWKWMRFNMVKKQIPELIRSGAVVIDVRTSEEFQSAHAEGAINIPLQDLPRRMSEIDRGRAVIVCCLSGGRRATAMTLLKKAGFENVVNAGPWQNVRV